jgi:putative transposase
VDLRPLVQRREGRTWEGGDRAEAGAAEDVRQLILRLAAEKGWGYTRILGELKKLGVRVARSTVVNIQKEAGLDTGLKGGAGSWAGLVARHAKTLGTCDFFTKKVWTLKGLVDDFVLGCSKN